MGDLTLISASSASSGAVAPGRAKYGGNAQLSIPGIQPSSNSTWGSAINRATYFPFLVDASVVIDQLVFEVTSGVAGNGRVAIYNADKDWQPTTLVSGTDTGNVDVAVAAVKTTTLGADVTLAAGRYLFWWNTTAGGVALRSVRSATLLGYGPTLGASPTFTQIYVAQAFGAPPSTGLAWDTVSTGSAQNQDNPIFLRIKTP